MIEHNITHGRARARWAAIGAAIAVSLGAGGLGIANAAIDSGAKPVTITVSPERVLDTRVNLGLAGAFSDAAPRDLVLTGDVAVAPSGTKTVVPADATGVIVNVTIVNPSAPGFLSLRPTGAAGAPATSTVNFSAAGAIVPNSATVALGTGGSIQIWVEIAGSVGSADVLIDIVGYTVDHNHDDRYYTEAEVDAAVAAAGAVAFVSNDGGATLSTTPAVLLTLPVTAPADGTLIVDGMVNIVDTASSASVSCWIGLDSTATTRAHGVQVLAANVGEWNDTRGFPVTAGDHTLTLSCEQQGTTTPMAAVQLRNLTATFSSNTL